MKNEQNLIDKFMKIFEKMEYKSQQILILVNLLKERNK